MAPDTSCTESLPSLWWESELVSPAQHSSERQRRENMSHNSMISGISRTPLFMSGGQFCRWVFVLPESEAAWSHHLGVNSSSVGNSPSSARASGWSPGWPECKQSKGWISLKEEENPSLLSVNCKFVLKQRATYSWLWARMVKILFLSLYLHI